MQLDPRIYFIVVIPDGAPHEATPMQGFALTLCRMSWAIRAAALMPTNIYDLTESGRETLLARRMSGTSPVNWYGQTPRAVRLLPHPDPMPFTLIILPPSESVADYQEWLASCATRPTMVAKSGGDLNEISLESLQKRFLDVCDQLPASIDPESIESAKEAIASWKALSAKRLNYQVGGHNSITPNLTALTVAGYEDMVAKRFDDINSGIQPYVDQIVKTTNSVLDERTAVGNREMQRIFRRPPDVNVFAPAIYPVFFDVPLPKGLDRSEQRSLATARQALQRQTGYGFEVRTIAQREALIGKVNRGPDGRLGVSPNALVSLRASELLLNTDLMAALTASEFSACVRLPNEINRTSGSVRNFAEHYRSDRPASRKRLLAFRAIQDRLASAIPPEFLDLVRRSESGIRIVSDAHLEWINLDGLPLAIRKNCSRIPVTPGNLFVDHPFYKRHTSSNA